MLVFGLSSCPVLPRVRALLDYLRTTVRCYVGINANTRACSATNSIEAHIVAPLSHPNNVTIHSAEAFVHRDLKLENVMETTVERTVKVGGYANNFMI